MTMPNILIYEYINHTAKYKPHMIAGWACY